MNIEDRIEKLWNLKKEGALTDKEFIEAKKLVLDVKSELTIIKDVIDVIDYAELDILWSDDRNKDLTDFKGDVYHFGESWNNNNYIRLVYKNGEVIHPSAGYQRGYTMWLDEDKVINLSHGHTKSDHICHARLTETPTDEGWMCDWMGKLDKRLKQQIYNHFKINI